MKKVSIIGHFGFGFEHLDGQTVKTKILATELERRFEAEQVYKIDTNGGIKTLFKAPLQAFAAFKEAENVVMLPAHNALRIYGRILPVLRHFFKKRKLHYVVIGGWLPVFLKKRAGLEKCLKKFDGIYVESRAMKAELDQKGFSNVFVMPNCKKLNILKEEELVYSTQEPYKLCTFSRVVKGKGIEDAAQAVKSINTKAGRNVFELNVYGPVDPNEKDWFKKLQQDFSDCVFYGGEVAFDKSVRVLKNHFALLFPTQYYTEGIPGTIIDAYAAGLPVICSKWQNFSDIVDEGVTGFGYEFANAEALQNVLENVFENPKALSDMKPACIKKAREYLPEAVTDILTKMM